MTGHINRITWAQRGVFATLGALLLASAPARADLLPALESVTPLGGDFVSTYVVTMTANPAVPDNFPAFFVLYDLKSYVAGSAQVATTGAGLWTTTETLLGPTPGLTAPLDNPALTNVAFFYTGPPISGGGAILSFSVKTTAAPGSLGGIEYASETFSGGAVQSNLGFTGGPVVAPVPEPSALFLCGLGASLALWHARSQRLRAA